MYQKDLTKYELSRFKGCSCRICNTPIMNDEPFEMIKHKSGKCTYYVFIHTICLFYPKKRVSFGEILDKINSDREDISLVN